MASASPGMQPSTGDSPDSGGVDSIGKMAMMLAPLLIAAVTHKQILGAMSKVPWGHAKKFEEGAVDEYLRTLSNPKQAAQLDKQWRMVGGPGKTTVRPLGAGADTMAFRVTPEEGYPETALKLTPPELVDPAVLSGLPNPGVIPVHRSGSQGGTGWYEQDLAHPFMRDAKRGTIEHRFSPEQSISYLQDIRRSLQPHDLGVWDASPANFGLGPTGPGVFDLGALEHSPGGQDTGLDTLIGYLQSLTRQS